MFRTAVLAGFLAFVSTHFAWAEITVSVTEKAAVVEVDGQLFTKYVTGYGEDEIRETPILWPIIGPTGKEMTRSYPMATGNPSEREDHPHHRSLWFTHGDVDGLSFWHREQIKHVRFVEAKSGDVGVLVTENEWVDREGQVRCRDQRTLTFGATKDARWIDFDIVLKAGHGPVKFGDTKEGTFGVRVAGTMKIDAVKNDPAWGGHVVNSEGQRDGDAWGKRAAWVDYHGPVEGETLGLAILNHPDSFRFPTYWHVRTYGLFAANPFGVHDFERDKSLDGSHTLATGESMKLHYRVLLHKGDEKTGHVAEMFSDYAAENR